MIAFWAICGVLVALAVAFVLIPLLRKPVAGNDVERSALNASLYQQQLQELDSDLKNDVLTDEQYAAGKDEVAKRLLEDVAAEPVPEGGAGRLAKTLAVISAIVVPALAVLIYLAVGSPKLADPQYVAELQARMQAGEQAGEGGQNQPMTAEKIQEMVGKLAARLEKNPEDAEGWTMLGRSYQVLKRYAEAAKAFEQVAKLLPNDAQPLAEYAEALMMASNNEIKGKPTELVERALKLDPDNQKALALAGAAAFEVKDYRKVVAYWERLYSQLTPGSDDARMVMGGIEGARKAAKAAGIKLPPPKVAIAQPAAGPKVSGTLQLDPKLASKVNPEDTLFIFARAATGPKMPLAILKIQAKELPLAFSLDDSLAVSPSLKLSDFNEVVVGARISKSGNAMPQSGDLEGLSSTVKLGAKDIHLLIDHSIP